MFLNLTGPGDKPITIIAPAIFLIKTMENNKTAILSNGGALIVVEEPKEQVEQLLAQYYETKEKNNE